MKYRAALNAEIIQLPFLYLPYNHKTPINKNVITLSNRKNRFDMHQICATWKRSRIFSVGGGGAGERVEVSCT